MAAHHLTVDTTIVRPSFREVEFSIRNRDGVEVACPIKQGQNVTRVSTLMGEGGSVDRIPCIQSVTGSVPGQVSLVTVADDQVIDLDGALIPEVENPIEWWGYRCQRPCLGSFSRDSRG